jgi:hypothetical protein
MGLLTSSGDRLFLEQGPQQYILTLNFPLEEEERSVPLIFVGLVFRDDEQYQQCPKY